MIFACAVANTRVHEQRLHKSGHKMSPFQYFKDNINEKFQGEVTRKIFKDFFSAIYRVDLFPGKELVVNNLVSDLVDALLEIAEYEQVVELVTLFIKNPNGFFNQITYQITDKKQYDNGTFFEWFLICLFFGIKLNFSFTCG